MDGFDTAGATLSGSLTIDRMPTALVDALASSAVPGDVLGPAFDASVEFARGRSGRRRRRTELRTMAKKVDWYYFRKG